MNKSKKKLISCLQAIAMAITPLTAFAEIEKASVDVGEVVSVKLDKTNEANGIEFLENIPNSFYTRDTNASFATFDGVGCKTIGTTQNNVDSYAYFRINDDNMYKINADKYMLIDYYDNAAVAFYIEYDGNDGEYVQSEMVRTCGGNKWKQAIIKLPNARFANSQHCASDFRIVVKYGYVYNTATTYLNVGNVAIADSIAQFENYKPFLELNSDKNSGGISGNYDRVNYSGKNAMRISGDEMVLDVDDRMGECSRNYSLNLEYYSNGAVFEISYKQDNEWISAGTFGGVDLKKYEVNIVDLKNIYFSGNAEDIKIRRISGKDPIYISAFDLKEFNEDLKIQNQIAMIDKYGETLVETKTDADKQITDKTVKYTSSGNSFEISFDVDERYISSSAADAFVELNYVNSGEETVYAQYTNANGELQKTAEYKLSSGEGTAYLILENAAMNNAMENGTDFSVTVNSQAFEVKSIKIYKNMPDSDCYYSVATDLKQSNGTVVSQQNIHNWKIQRYSGDTFVDLKYASSVNKWTSNGTNNTWPRLYMERNEFVMDGANGALSWTAPKKGKAVIYSAPHMQSYQSQSDGVKPMIYKNTEILDEFVVSNTDTIGEKKMYYVEVEKGDILHFRGHPNNDASYDWLCWTPKIVFFPSDETQTTKEIVEASITLSKTPTEKGLSIDYDNSSIVPGSSYILLVDDYSDTPKIAFKMSEEYRYRDTDNPIYVEVEMQDRGTNEVWCEYRDKDGNIRKTNSATPTFTGVNRKISFCLENADFNAEDSWNFMVCAKQLDATVLYSVRTSRTVPDSYVLSLEANNASSVGLTLLEKASEGITNGGHKVLNKSTIEFQGKAPYAVIDVDNTYAYLNNGKNLNVKLEYLDNLSEFYIEYKDVSGKTVKSETVVGTGGNTWRNAVLQLKNVSYDNGFDGGDIKICATNRDKLCLHKISASMTTFTDYYIGTNNGNAGDATGITMKSSTTDYKGKKAVKLAKDGDAVRFDIDNTVYYDLNADDTVYNITVTYFDAEDVQFKLAFDGKAVYDFPAHNVDAWHVVTTGTNKWKTACFPISNVYFKNGHTDSSDFSVVKVDGNADLWIAGCTLQKGYGELYDIASEDCIIKSSGMIMNSDIRKNAAFSAEERAFTPEHTRMEGQRPYDGSFGIASDDNGYDWYEVYFPSLEPQTICGVGFEHSDRFKIEYKDAKTGEWTTVQVIENAKNLNVSYKHRIVTFSPVEATAVRINLVVYSGAAGPTKISVYSNQP